jgi:hypothetical protein
MKRWRAWLRATICLVLALILLFEEWGWGPLARAMAMLARLPLWAWVERRIAALPPWGALVAMFVPMVVLFPLKLLALYLFGIGRIAWGIAMLVSAKIGGTAMVARLFFLTLPALMRIGWFARWYPRWKVWKDGLLAWVRSSPAWRMVARWRLRWRRRAGAWWIRTRRNW